MSEARFNVVVIGTVLEGFELPQVMQDFAKLFQLGEEKAQQIFNKGNVAIKKNVDELTAQQFIQALEKIGAAAHLLPIADAIPTPAEKVNEPQIQKSHVDISKPAAGNTENQTKAEDSRANTIQESVLAFNFLGNGSEYFRIWIVNILLTMATLGIYSAWAKVRNAQYFYGHTEIAGSRFAYLAKPITILIGRIIAVVIFVVFSIVAELFPLVGVALSLLLILVLPWIVIRSLRFNARMSAWRNIRFGFDGKIGGAIGAFILWPLAGLISFGLLMPLAVYNQTQFIINNSRYGTAKFKLHPCDGKYYMIYVKVFAMAIVAGLIIALIGWALPESGIILVPLLYFYLFAFISVQSSNLIYNNSSFDNGNFAFHSFWEQLSYLKLIFLNSLFTLLTLGLYIPWAKVRMAEYKAEHMEIVSLTNLDGFVAGQEDKINAFGEEFGDVFDMEVGI